MSRVGRPFLSKRGPRSVVATLGSGATPFSLADNISFSSVSSLIQQAFRADDREHWVSGLEILQWQTEILSQVNCRYRSDCSQTWIPSCPKSVTPVLARCRPRYRTSAPNTRRILVCTGQWCRPAKDTHHSKRASRVGPPWQAFFGSSKCRIVKIVSVSWDSCWSDTQVTAPRKRAWTRWRKPKYAR